MKFWMGVATGLFAAAIPGTVWVWLAAGLVLTVVLTLWPRKQPASNVEDA
jgi:hypothetical protein